MGNILLGLIKNPLKMTFSPYPNGNRKTHLGKDRYLAPFNNSSKPTEKLDPVPPLSIKLIPTQKNTSPI